jgi:hypothetical protein
MSAKQYVFNIIQPAERAGRAHAGSLRLNYRINYHQRNRVLPNTFPISERYPMHCISLKRNRYYFQRGVPLAHLDR